MLTLKKLKEKDTVSVKEVKQIETEILSEVKKIEALEESIKKSEKLIDSKLSKGLKPLLKDGISVAEARLIKSSTLKKIAKHKFVYTLITTTGVVLVWRGLWDVTELMPVLENSIAALIIGFMILWFVEKYTEL